MSKRTFPQPGLMLISPLACALALGGCERESRVPSTPSEPAAPTAQEPPAMPGPDTVEDPPPPADLPVPTTAALPVYQLSQLAEPPEWDRLDLYQNSLTRPEFERLLRDVYCEGEAWRSTISISDDHAEIRRSTASLNGGTFRLYFAKTPPPAGTPAPPRFWRAASELPPATDLERRPLEGVRIAIDPGHIGGEWAKVEERWFQIGDGGPVMEGRLSLKVAELLSVELANLGATVLPVRTREEPVTKLRIPDLEVEARSELRAMGIDPEASGDGVPTQMTVAWRAEKLFYRTAEIRARADLINTALFPDVTLCLHFNAAGWGDPAKPTLVSGNHLHILVNGCYSESEIRLDDQRFEMLLRLLQRTSDTEIALSDAVAASFAEATGLDPFTYTGTNAQRVSASPYVWARNLLANRTYRSPVIFLEPYVMNTREVYQRIQAGDYPGTRSVAGQDRPSIFREYASAVAAGVANYYRETRADR